MTLRVQNPTEMGGTRTQTINCNSRRISVSRVSEIDLTHIRTKLLADKISMYSNQRHFPSFSLITTYWIYGAVFSVKMVWVAIRFVGGQNGMMFLKQRPNIRVSFTVGSHAVRVITQGGEYSLQWATWGGSARKGYPVFQASGI